MLARPMRQSLRSWIWQHNYHHHPLPRGERCLHAVLSSVLIAQISWRRAVWRRKTPHICSTPVKASQLDKTIAKVGCSRTG